MFDPVAFTLEAIVGQLAIWTALGIQLLLVVPCAYLFVVGIASRRRLEPPPHPDPDWPRLAVILPAHDEARTLPRLLESLADVDYPAGAWQIVLVADNCTDNTAAVARATGRRLGLPLTVWERDDAFARGKGHALAWALARLGDEHPEAFDGWVIFDADTVVDRDCLKELAAGLAAGHLAVQGRYGIQDPESTPRRQLAYISNGLYQGARAHGREALGLSAGLFGNGMAFDWSLAEQIGWPAFSVVEDIEYQAILALHGVRVAYQPEARLWAEMPSTLKASTSQRQRWERGRYALIRYYFGKLLAAAVNQRSVLPLAMAIDLAMPSFTLLVGAVVLSGLLVYAGGSAALWVLSLACLSLYVALGMAHVRGPAWLGRALLWAPVYAAWVVLVNLKPKAPKTWVRTPREQK